MVRITHYGQDVFFLVLARKRRLPSNTTSRDLPAHGLYSLQPVSRGRKLDAHSQGTVRTTTQCISYY